MNISKKITAGAVALALGTSALAAPQAQALPSEFSSPTMPDQETCQVKTFLSFDSGRQNREDSRQNKFGNLAVGFLKGTPANNEQTIYVWATATGDDERINDGAELTLELRNLSTAKRDATYSVEPLDPAQYTLTGYDGTKVELSPTTTVRSELTEGKLAVDEGVRDVIKLQGIEQVEKAKAVTWAWKITVPHDATNFRIQVSEQGLTNIEPWTIENDLCQPIIPQDNSTKPIIADGTEYDTGISVKNAAAADLARLSGEVFIKGKKLDDATVRIAENGNIFVTLQPGSTGDTDNLKPGEVTVKLTAAPREKTQNSKYGSYNAPQVLLNEDTTRPGTVTGASTEFEAIVPIAQFEPNYNTTDPVAPGKSATVTIASFENKLREAKGKVYEDSNTTFKLDQTEIDGWKLEINPKTGELTATAPEDVKDATTITVPVTVTYPDGSTDPLTATFTSTNLSARDNNAPGYGEVADKPSKTVDLDQTGTVTDKATYTISKDQELGEWKPTVDKSTGKITVTIPKNAQPGESKIILVDVTYPDGSIDPKVPATASVLNTPEDVETTGKPTDTVTLEPAGPVADGTTYELPEQDFEGWEPKIDPNTGVITVTIPEEAKPGTSKSFTVQVNDPNSDTPDTVTATVDVIDPYPETRTTPGTTVTIVPRPNEVPKDSTFEIVGKPDWDAETDPNTGVITVVIPEDEDPTDTPKVIEVAITTPGEDKVTVEAPVIIVEKEPETTTTPAEPTPKPAAPTTTPDAPATDETDKPGEPTTTPGEPTTVTVTPEVEDGGGTYVIVIPGTSIELNPTVVDGNPEGTKFRLDPDFKVPEGWTITVDPKTGKLTVTAPENAKPGTEVVVPVEITLPSGKTVIRQVPVRVGEPATEGGEKAPTYTIGQKDPLIVYVPKDTDGDKVKLPEGWEYTRDGNKIIITVPEGTKPGTYPVQFPKTDGTGTVVVNVDVKKEEAQTAVTEQGSSEAAQRCLTNLAESPLPYLVPAAILLAVGAPLVGQMGPEIGRAIANVSAQLNIDIPNPFAGIGGERRQSPAAAQLQAEIARLQNQFGPAVTQAAAVALGVIALAATAGLFYAYCVGKDPELKSSEGSSGDE